MTARIAGGVRFSVLLYRREIFCFCAIDRFGKRSEFRVGLLPTCLPRQADCGEAC